MATFDNVRLDYQNVSFGPDAGRIYSIDHVTDTMVVKTNPGGSLVTTIPLDNSIQNEVRSLEYDGYYWWTLSKIGLNEDLGVVIQRWKLEDNLLKKQFGPGNEIVLSNTASITFDSEAMVVRTLTTSFDSVATSGDSVITLDSTEFLEIGDDIYLGPSTANSGELELHRVLNIIGSNVQLTNPIQVDFNSGDKIIYRKHIWLFNEYNGIYDDAGSLIRINSYTGTIFGYITSSEWKHVSAAKCRNGNLAFVRGLQYLEYKPYGINSGYQTSIALNNIEVDNTTLIKVYDIAIDSLSVHKLQTTLHWFNPTNEEYEDVDSTDNKYNLEQEYYAPKIRSISVIRDVSEVYDEGAVSEFTIKVLDQYNVPVFGRSLAISDDDASGFIVGGFESITTDIDGEGVSKYNSGLLPDFAVPEIKARDLITGYNLKFLLTQTPYIDNDFYVEQSDYIRNGAFIEQDDAIGTYLVTQEFELTTFFYVSQDKPPKLEKYIVQRKDAYDLNIIQERPLEMDIYLEQAPLLEESINVTQYEFLIFAIPEPYSVKNAPDADILVRIIGFGAIALNPSTLVFVVNGINVSNQVSVSSFGVGLELLYSPLEAFDYSSTVSVYIQVEDIDSPPNIVSTYYTFDIVGDFRSPYLHEAFPPDNSVNNAEDTEVYAIIKDLETGIDTDTISMVVEGREVTPIVTVIDINTVKVSYQTSCDYPFQSIIAVGVSASDNEGNKFIGLWSFTVKNSPGVLFINTEPENCSVLVPVSTDICSEIFGLSEGIRIDTLSFNVEGKEVSYLLKPKVYRKE